MDRPIVLSHRTAWLFYHAPHRHEVLSSSKDFGIAESGITAREIGRRIQQFLLACGIPEQQIETLDVIVSMDFERANAKSSLFVSHTFGTVLTARDVHELIPGLCVVCESLCFMQAGSWMSDLALIGFGYELCGRYELALDGGPYRERTPLLSREQAMTYIDAHVGTRGAKRAKSALVRVRNRSRSPMETATALMIALPRKLGGLGFRGIELNYQLAVPANARALTSSPYLEVDIYAPGKRVGVEYDGEDHAEAPQRARDAERLATLAAMGVRTHIITKGQFSEQLSFHRALNAIARDLGIHSNVGATFQRAQNQLRLELIQSWNRA